MRFGNFPWPHSTEPSTTSNNRYKQELQQHQSLEQTGEQKGDRQAALQQASPAGILRGVEQDPGQPCWMETPPTALSSVQRGVGRVSWSVASTAVYGGYAFPRVCFNREHETHSFMFTFPLHPPGTSDIFWEKNPLQKQPTAHQPRWFPNRLPSLRGSCPYRVQPGLFRQLKSGLTSSPLESKNARKGRTGKYLRC